MSVRFLFVFWGFSTLNFIGCFSKTNGRIQTLEYDKIGYEGSDVHTMVKRDSLGNKLIEGNFINGKKNGSWITYLANGQIIDITNYIDDVKQGPFVKLSGSNQVTEMGVYKDNKLNGTVLRYLYGRMNEKLEFKDGIRNGMTTTYYQSGVKQREMEVIDSIQEGIYRFYGENGVLQIEEEFRKGKKISGGIIRNNK